MILGRLYEKIGMHAAPRGTLLYYAHHAIHRLYFALVRRRPAPEPPPPKKIRQTEALAALRISGGIGDYLIAARYIRDLMEAVGAFRFDIYGGHKVAIALAFGTCSHFNKSYEEYLFEGKEVWKETYPLAIWISQFVTVYDEYMDKDAVRKTNPKLLDIAATIRRFIDRNDITPFIANHPYLDNALARKAVFLGLNRYTIAQGMSGIPYGGDLLSFPSAPATLAKFGLSGKKYITIHNGFDEHLSEKCTSTKSMTKIYPRFDDVIENVKDACGDIIVVQIGTRTSVPIAGVDVNLVNQTSLPEVAEILRHSLLHIDDESGMVHVAACVGTKTCVVFGPSVADYYVYADNINIYPRFCGGCAWATRDWMTTCPRGLGEPPPCLTETPPAAVGEAIIACLNENRAAFRRSGAA